ncbi:MAG: electron transfer flavoprotein-ubiquinone oxidoreductase [Hyphomicrobiales bacterium]|nr:MAG: electron transfer flavoprotein-ubiquinone oxidoreductase [Hyphomicrobiales bacterium]
MTEREAIPFDVVIVGAGPAGLAAAIKLKQLADASGVSLAIAVLEKSAEIGGHILSGAIIDPAALNALLPDWQARGAPLGLAVASDEFRILGAQRSVAIPSLLLPPQLANHGCYIASLGNLCRWLGEQAVAMGIDVFPGFAATEMLHDETGRVTGVATGDVGDSPGIELHARYTLIAEGARGSLAKGLIARFGLDQNSEPQHYGLGIKEVWEIPAAQHRAGHVEHHLGWPLRDDTGGGGFVYHAEGTQVVLGYVVHLNYSNPWLSPFDEMQRWKTHPRLRTLLAGGRRIAYGARAMTSGGLQSIPQLAFPGGALIGCSAGFMNVPRIKGSHNAMWSGIGTAEAVFAALTAGRSHDAIEDLRSTLLAGPIGADLRPARNAKPMLSKFGTRLGTLLSGIDLWANALIGRSPFGTLRHPAPDHTKLRLAQQSARIDYPAPDGKLTFDRLSSVFLANLQHDEGQPVHLRLRDPAVPVRSNLPLYAEPAQRYCPAGVYEIETGADGQPTLRINAANCVHCKACDIKDPAANIDWVPPQGGSGPNYAGM